MSKKADDILRQIAALAFSEDANRVLADQLPQPDAFGAALVQIREVIATGVVISRDRHDI